MHLIAGQRKLATSRCVFTLAWLAFGSLVDAHEGHRPLPTRGMEVNVETGSMVLTKAARETLDVLTVEAVNQPLTQSIQAYGSIVAPWNNHAVIASPLSGRIIELKVSPGEGVQTGQVLATMESPELQQLVLELRAAQVDLQLSTKLVDNMRQASLSGAIAGVRLIEANTKLEQDKSAVELAAAKWQSLRLPPSMLDTILASPDQDHRQLLELRSPIDGVVTHADLSIGKVVDPKEHLFEILDLRTVWLKVQVLESDLAKVAVGQPVELRTSGDRSHAYRGVVDVVDSFLDPETHLGTVWATLTNDAGSTKLLPGMSGSVRLDANAKAESLSVPVAAVQRDGAERFVLVEQEQTATASIYQKQPLVLGERAGDWIEVRGGSLYPSDRVVTRGSHQLGSFFAKGVLAVSSEAARDIGLETDVASMRLVAETIEIDGVVDVPPTHRSVASAQLGGSIGRILVDRAQRVTRGQVLAEIASQPFQTLQLDLLQANLNVQLKQKTVENLRTASDAVARRQLWENESLLNQMKSRRDAILQQLKTAGLTDAQIEQLAISKQIMNALPVRAAMDGVIVGFDKYLGHVVQPDEPLFEIHNLGEAWVEGFISERDFPVIGLGQSVRIRFVAAPEQIILGTIARSGEAISAVDRTLSIWIELQDMPNFPLQHNLLARISIETGDAVQALAVPWSAIVREGMRSYLFVEGPDKTFERRFVETGSSNDLTVAIINGLQPGEVVAVGGTRALQSGYAALK